jgi:hypothetical protein
VVTADSRCEADGGDERNADGCNAPLPPTAGCERDRDCRDGHRSDGVSARKRPRLSGRRVAVDQLLQDRDERRGYQRRDEEHARPHPSARGENENEPCKHEGRDELDRATGEEICCGSHNRRSGETLGKTMSADVSREPRSARHSHRQHGEDEQRHDETGVAEHAAADRAPRFVATSGGDNAAGSCLCMS